MGADMRMTSAQFKILPKHEAYALQAIKELVAGPEKISWIDPEEIKKARTLDEALKGFLWYIERDENGVICDIDFEGEKAGDEEKLFKAIAMAVELDSFIEVNYPGYNENERFCFNGASMYIQKGKLVYNSEDEEEADANSNKMEEYAARLDEMAGRIWSISGELREADAELLVEVAKVLRGLK